MSSRRKPMKLGVGDFCVDILRVFDWDYLIIFRMPDMNGDILSKRSELIPF
jgi:hypothetical protein